MDAIEHALRVGMAMAGPGIELEPLPCPFCGQPAKLQRTSYRKAGLDGEVVKWSIGCPLAFESYPDKHQPSCYVRPCQVMIPSKEEAIRRWNTRK